MARVKKNVSETAEIKPSKIEMSKFLKTLNSDSGSLASNSLCFTKEWIDTGSYALNAILSGSLYGGIPVGLITGFSGPSQSGKSLMVAKIVANAQKKGYQAIVWDSEGAWDEGMKNLGVDIDRCFIMPVATVEETKTQIIQTLAKIKDNDKGGKYIFVLDSLGALSSEKELKDSEDGSTAVDMGTRAKVIKAMSRQIAIKCKSLNIPFIFTNHIYDNPAQMMPSLVKNQSGGSGPKYLSTVLVQFGLRNEKNEDKSEEGNLSGKISGSIIPALTIKNRGVPHFLDTMLYINFRSGLDKYYGLFELCQKYGVITGERTYTLEDGTTLGYKKTFINDADKWETLIMPLLEKKLKMYVKYSDESNPVEPDALSDGESDDIEE